MLGKIKIKIKKMYYTNKVKIQCGNCKKNLKVNFNTVVTGNTFLGENVNFNGMKIMGKGKVEIGDNFHSGQECMIITDVHNYDEGNAIPYDSSYICKDVKPT